MTSVSHGEVEAVNRKIRDVLSRRGAHSIVGLGRSFRHADTLGTGALSYQRFKTVMREYNVPVSDTDLYKLFAFYDADGNQAVTYDEFLVGLRGRLNQVRRAVVRRAFDKLDRTGDGVVTTEDLRGVYNARFHPEVKKGEKTEEQVLAEMVDHFDTIDRDGKVTFEEFEKYYGLVSASIDSDEHFVLLLENAWKLNATTAPGAAGPGSPGAGRYSNTPASKTSAPFATDANAGPIGRVAAQLGGATRSVGGGGAAGAASSENAKALRDRLAQALANRGTRSIFTLGKSFKIMDDDNSHALNFAEFCKGMRDFRAPLNDAEMATLFKYFDRDGSGQMDYDEFLVGLRGELNDFRKALVKRAFDRMDADGSGEIDMFDIRAFYNAKMHPDVKAKKRTEESVLLEFLDTFDVGNHDGKVTLAEFEEYYANVSASVDRDDYFELMMTNVWRLNEPAKRIARPSAAAAEAAARESEVVVPQAIQTLLDRMRATLARRGADGIVGLGRSFRIMDDDRSGCLSFAEFVKAMRSYGVAMHDVDIRTLYDFYDRNHDGSLDYNELLRGMRGELNERRLQLVQAAFKKLDVDGSGVLTVEDISALYNGRDHPEVRAGRKTERQVLNEFLGNFDVIERDGRVTYEEFVDYYKDISASVDNDNAFALIMNNAWRFNAAPARKGERFEL